MRLFSKKKFWIALILGYGIMWYGGGLLLTRYVRTLSWHAAAPFPIGADERAVDIRWNIWKGFPWTWTIEIPILCDCKTDPPGMAYATTNPFLFLRGNVHVQAKTHRRMSEKQRESLHFDWQIHAAPWTLWHTRKDPYALFLHSSRRLKLSYRAFSENMPTHTAELELSKENNQTSPDVQVMKAHINLQIHAKGKETFLKTVEKSEILPQQPTETSFFDIDPRRPLLEILSASPSPITLRIGGFIYYPASFESLMPMKAKSTLHFSCGHENPFIIQADFQGEGPPSYEKQLHLTCTGMDLLKKIENSLKEPSAKKAMHWGYLILGLISTAKDAATWEFSLMSGKDRQLLLNGLPLFKWFSLVEDAGIPSFESIHKKIK